MKRILKIAIYLLILPAFFMACEDDASDTEQTDDRDMIERRWRCTEDVSVGDPPVYDVDIIKLVGTDNQVELDNFAGFGFGISVTATYDNYLLTIDPNQAISGYEVTGTGNVAADYSYIEWTYTLSDGNATDEITATFEPQDIVAKKALALLLEQ